MMRAYRWLIPHPLLTLILAVVWVLLQNQISAGMVVFGIILGILLQADAQVRGKRFPG